MINDETGVSEGCHATEDTAKRQQAALYANTDDAQRAEWTAEQKAKAKAKLEAAARQAGVGDRCAVVPDDLTEVRTKTVPLEDVQLLGDGLTFSGYAAVFDEVADLGDFSESVARGAFRKVLRTDRNVPMLWDHSPFHPPLATTRGGTLRLKEDETGLRVEADLDPRHYLTATIQSMVESGDVRGMSWGFVAGAGNSKVMQRSGKPHRELTGFKQLLDVSPTWDPAYSATSVEMRSLRALQLAEDLEAAQQLLGGAQPQPEDGATADQNEDQGAVAGVSEAEQEHSGVASVKLAAARRRLQVMEATIPKEYRR